jgi:predicted kinase
MARLIALAGLPGVGKSSNAQHLARRCGAIWLRIDSMDQAIWASGTAPKDLLDSLIGATELPKQLPRIIWPLAGT